MEAWLLAANLVVLQIPDVLTTNRILAGGGRELNPVMRACMRLGRLWWLPKIAVTLAGAAYLALQGGTDGFWMLAGLNGLYVVVVVSNLRQIARMGRRPGLALRPPLRSLNPAPGGRISPGPSGLK